MDLGSLTKKYGPLPAWTWALIVSIILFLLYRHFKGSASSSTAAQSPPATDTSSVDGSVAATPPVDSSGFSGPIDSSGNPADLLPNTGVDQSSSTPWWADPGFGGDPGLTFGDPVNAAVPPLSSPPPTSTGPTPTPKPATKKVTHPPLKSIIPGVTGKVISQKVLPSGAKLVTLQGGRQIEQAKGKKAYVVKKGK